MTGEEYTKLTGIRLHAPSPKDPKRSWCGNGFRRGKHGKERGVPKVAVKPENVTCRACIRKRAGL